MKVSGKKLYVPDPVASFIRHLHPHLKSKIRHGLACIVGNPECGKTLKQELQGLRSLPVGRFRIIYKIGFRRLEIIAVGPRKSIYAETFRLLQKE